MRPSLASSFPALISVLAAVVLVGHAQAPVHADELSPDLQTSRAALDKYQDPFTAIREGYLSTVGCVAFTTASMLNGMPYPAGAMGVHFVNMSLVGPTLDPLKPQVLIYEPLPDGKLQLAAAEWFMPYSKGMKPPQLFGHAFYGPMMGHYPVMPKELVHYDLHVWLWKHNPAGTFSPTNPDVKCPTTGYNFAQSTPDMPMP
jgi:hypothetical protein